MESVAPIALGLIFMYIFMNLRLRKGVVSIYYDRQASRCGPEVPENPAPKPVDGFGRGLRREILADMIYEEFLMRGRFMHGTAVERMLADGASAFGILDIRRADSFFKHIKPRLLGETGLSMLFFNKREFGVEISKYTRNSGLILMLLPNLNLEVRLAR